MRLFTAIASLSPLAIGILASVASASPSSASETFSMCYGGHRITCVVDGDTFWFRAEKIRIADIDTPELSPPRCERERKRGCGETASARHPQFGSALVQDDRQG